VNYLSNKRFYVVSIICLFSIFVAGCATVPMTTKKIFPLRTLQGYSIEDTGTVGVLTDTVYKKENIHPSTSEKLNIKVEVKGKDYIIAKRDRSNTTPIILLPFAGGSGVVIPGPDSGKEVLSVSISCDGEEVFSENYSYKDIIGVGFRVGPLTAGSFDVVIEISPMWDEEKERRGLLQDSLYIKGLWVNIKVNALTSQ